MNVHWTESALRHLSAIHDYISQDSPIYARDFVDRITSRSKQIADFPVREEWCLSTSTRTCVKSSKGPTVLFISSSRAAWT
ncbi:MAG: type II toxin-antitoxin system RelE/ParE family toxin [Gemmatimonadota bacterium]